MQRLDWKEAAFHAKERPLMMALMAGTVFFAMVGLLALAVRNMDVALAMALVMVVFYFLSLMAHSER
ncbi:MAG: hypothetical protein ACR2PK_16270 [Acidimicrobiales bacterium]